MDEFEAFEPCAFVGRLLGRSDWAGLLGRLQGGLPAGQQEALEERLASGQMSLRLLYDQYQSLQAMGSLSSMMAMVPGLGSRMQGGDAASIARMRRMMTLMDSMTDAELDCTDVKVLSTPSRLERIARGAGRPLQEAHDLLEEFKRMAKMLSGLKGMRMPKRGGVSPLAQSLNLAQMQKAVPPEILRQLGGTAGLQQMMKALDGPAGR